MYIKENYLVLTKIKLKLGNGEAYYSCLWVVNTRN